MPRRSLMPPLLVAAFVFMPTTLAHASRTNVGTIEGTVEDRRDGTPLPGVTVTATNAKTSKQRVATTTDTGRFSLPDLPPGDYGLKASIREAKRFAVITLEGGATVRQTFSLDTTHQEGALVYIRVCGMARWVHIPCPRGPFDCPMPRRFGRFMRAIDKLARLLPSGVCEPTPAP